LILKLAREELRSRLRVLAMVSIILFPGLTFSLAAGPNGYRIAVPLTVALLVVAYNQRTTYDDDKARGLPFLRSLPISPTEIVCVKALVSATVTIVYTGLALIATALCVRFIPGHGSPDWPGSAVAGLGVGLLTMSLTHAIYFRLDAKAVGTLGAVMLFAAAIPSLAVNSAVRDAPVVRSLLQTASGATNWCARNPSAVAVIVGATAVLATAAGWAYAAWALSHKEFL